MRNNWVKHISFIFLFLGIIPLDMFAQSVGINSVVVVFETNPTLVNISKTPLKFDKEFALSFHIKNANKDIYTHAFPFLNGGLVDGVNYPGLTFTDGCDNEVNFKMGTSLYSFAADGITDIHAQSNNFINWTEAIELYQAGWGIFSQGVLPDNSGDPSYSIARNHSYVKSKTFQSITGGIPMTVLMNPEGDTTFSTTAFDQDYRAAFASYTKGIQYYDISLIPNNDSLKMGINSMDNQQSLAALVDLMHNNHSYATRFWASANLSTITDGNTDGYSFSTFRFYMDYIESKYGSGGFDNIWMTNEEEVWDYLTIYDLTTIHKEVLDDRLLITFSGTLPTHLNHYALSLLIESDANIQSIEVNGGSNNTFKIKADTSALINMNWDGKVLIADSVLAENYVVIAEINRTTNDVLVAIDYVNMLDLGPKKEELRNRLCAITEATLPLGYCDCEFSLGNDTTICKNDCIDLTGASGTSYLWSTGATTQTINVCPSDTTEYWLTIFNEYDCYFTDTILINVIPDNFAHASADMIICESSCVDLTVTSGASYLWTTGKTTQTITVCPDVEKKYYAIVTDALGCVSIDSVTISIEELPTTQISADVSICKFDSTILTISGATNYLWSTHDDTNSIKVSPADTTKYYVWSWNENNCLIKDSVTVNIIPLPLAQAGNDTTICFGDCVTLSANNEYIHEWSTNETTQNIDVCPIDTTTYYLTVTNEQNCSNIDSVKVFVNPIPETLSSNDTIICPGECVKIWVNGGINYLWDTEETTDTIEVCPTESTKYYVSVFNSLGCETIDSVYVEVFNATNVSLTDDLSICPDDCITLTAAGGYTYEWSTGGNNNKITVCPEADSMYYVTVYNEFNCSATDSVLVSLRTPPIVDAGLDSEICFGDCATLTASDGSAYYWNTDETSQSIEVCPTDTSTYYVTVEDQFGCTNIDSVTINVKPTPETLTSNDTIVCPRECIKIWVSGGSNYLWDTGETTDTIEVCPTEATRYYVSVFNDLGCETIDDVFVNVYANANAGEDVSICPGSCVTLVATGGYGYDWSTGAETNTIEVCPEETTWYSVSVRNEYNCYTTDSVLVTLLTPPTVDAGIDVSKCISDCIDLEATGALTYLWSTESSSNIIEVCPSTETKYYVTGTDEFGCSSIDSVTVEINDHPDVILSGILPVYCEGASSVLLEGSPANGSFGGNGVNGNIFSPSNAGLGQHQVYYSIVDNTGCAIADTINVNIYEVPDFSLGEDVTLCSDETLEIFIPSGYDQYLWSNGNTSNNYLMVEFSSFGMGTTVVELVATNNGCVARDEIQITFVSCNVGIENLEDIGIKIYPNPNSGIFRIAYDGSEDNQYFSIYNMQGQEIYAKELNKCHDSNCSIDIDASFLNKGMYLIRFFSEKGIRTAKLIIQ